MVNAYEIEASKIMDFANFVNPIMSADNEKYEQFCRASKEPTANGNMRVFCDSTAFFAEWLNNNAKRI